MTKRTKRMGARRGRSTGNNNMGEVVRVPFRNVEYFSTTASTNWTSGMFTLRPDYLGDVAASISLNYKLYRVTSLKVKVSPPVGGYTYTPSDIASSTYAASFTNIEPASAPGGFATMSQMPSYVEGSGYKELSFTVPRAQLLGVQPKWFSVKSDAVDTTDNVLVDQGWLYLGYYTDSVDTHTMRVYVEFSGIIEFRDPEDQSISLDAFGVREMKESKFRTVSALLYVFPKGKDVQMSLEHDEKSMLRAEEQEDGTTVVVSSPLSIPPLIRQTGSLELRNPRVNVRPQSGR
jgi:hypothetical protein